MANDELSDVVTRTAVLEHRVDATDRALEVLRYDMNQGFADLRAQVDRRFEHLDGRLGQMDGRLDRMDAGFDQMNTRLDRQLRWIITTVITSAFAAIGANVGILTLLLRGR